MVIFDIGKSYQTRDGKDVVLKRVTFGQLFPIDGAIKEHNQWVPTKWTINGKYAPEQIGALTNLDLIEIKPEGLEKYEGTTEFDGTTRCFRPISSCH